MCMMDYLIILMLYQKIKHVNPSPLPTCKKKTKYHENLQACDLTMIEPSWAKLFFLYQSLFKHNFKKQCAEKSVSFPAKYLEVRQG